MMIRRSKGVVTIKCCVPFCHSSSLKPAKNVSFHLFPKNKKLRERWSTAVSEKEKEISIHSNLFLCSRHFTKDDFKPGKKTLKIGAIPSVGLIAVKPRFTRSSMKADDSKRVDFAAVALCMKEAVTSFKIATEQPNNNRIPASSAPSLPPEVIKVKKSVVVPHDNDVISHKKLTIKPRQKPTVKREQQQRLTRRMTRSLSTDCVNNAATKHQIPSPILVPVPESTTPTNRTSCNRLISASGSTTTFNNIASRLITSKLSSVKAISSTPSSISSKLKINPSVQFKKAARKILQSRVIPRSRSTGNIKTSSRKPNLNFKRPIHRFNVGGGGSAEERKEIRAVQTLFSNAISKVFSDSAAGLIKNVAPPSLSHDEEYYNHAENKYEFADHYKEEGSQDPLEENGNVKNVKVDVVDINDEEYDTPLLNGFGFDHIGSHHDDDGDEEFIVPDRCEDATSNVSSTDDNYFALIPNVEVKEEGDDEEEVIDEGSCYSDNNDILKLKTSDADPLE